MIDLNTVDYTLINSNMIDSNMIDYTLINSNMIDSNYSIYYTLCEKKMFKSSSQ